MAESSDVIVVEDSEDEKNNIDCPICLQTSSFPTRLPCGHVFCFLCVKGVANKNRRCALCRRDIPIECLEHPQLVRGTKDLNNSNSNDFRWFYEGRNGGWWAYEMRSAEELEENFQRDPQSSFELLISGSLYCIDLSTMKQFLKGDTHRRRSIKRETDSKFWIKGVAGISKVNSWWQYDDRTSMDIEDAFQKKEKTSSILVAGHLYLVDFESMAQLRQDDNSRRRRVKRDLGSISKKGIAGLRIDSGGMIVTDITPTTSTESVLTSDVPIPTLGHTQNQQSTTESAIRIATHIIDSTLANSDDQSSDETGRDVSQDIFDDSDLLEGIRNLTLRNMVDSSDSENENIF